MCALSNDVIGTKALKNVHPWVNNDDSAFDKCLREGTSGSEPQITSRCCKAQMAVSCSPINTFLTLMNTSNWPQRGTLKVSSLMCCLCLINCIFLGGERN